ncbi:ThiF family adenylyltransferase [Methylomagnum sp.]
MDGGFDYGAAFKRNIGWVTVTEQSLLRRSRVAIAGMGGVGGGHLLTLVRLGVGAFHIADFDSFDLTNFNRQAGASVSSLGQPKVDILAGMALSINPQLDLVRFPDGVSSANLDRFLAGVDVYVDGLDFFAFEARSAVFAACRRLGIPAVTAAPLGMSAALLCFVPGGLSFEDYFGLQGQDETEQGLRFLVGLAPTGLHGRALIEPASIDLKRKRGPSTAMGCELCAGLAASETLKLLLKRGEVRSAPHGIQFDAYSHRLVHTWRPGGHRNPWQRRALRNMRRQFLALAGESQVRVDLPDPAAKILDIARWAPSGDNTQPWRFEISDGQHFTIRSHDARKDGVYDLDGRSSRLAIGGLLESIAIAAAEFGFRAEFRRHSDPPTLVIEVGLNRDPAVALSPLFPYIPLRATQRRPLSRAALTLEEKARMEEIAGAGHRILWLEGGKARRRVANLLFRNAQIRLSIPEAYEVHKSIIQWSSQFSKDRIPDRALGLDPLTRRLMRWSLGSWKRAQFFGANAAGTLVPRLELDWLPAYGCGAHFALVAESKSAGIDEDIEAGRAMQRVWLMATRLGLQMQPEMTPVIFARYVREGRRFTVDEKAYGLAERLAENFAAMLGPDVLERTVFFGRVGRGRAPESRSVRLPLEKLMWEIPSS